MAVTMAEISKLRTMTGAGMMDCKNALTEAEGDFDKAVEIIRKKGQAVAAKRSDREASEGCVLAKANGDFAAVLALKCETDFVAKNEDFIALTRSILEVAMEQKPATLEDLKAAAIDGRTVAELVTDRSGITGEKMELDYYETVSGGATYAYIHPGNKLATVVSVAEANADLDVVKGIAMQAAAMSPIALDENAVPQSVKDNELQVAIDKTKLEQVSKAVEVALKKAGFNLYISESEEHLNEGIMKGSITEAQAEEIRQLKANVSEAATANMNMQMVENIAKGRMTKFFKESTLLEQTYIMDNKTPVKDVLKAAGITATGFKRVTLNQE